MSKDPLSSSGRGEMTTELVNAHWNTQTNRLKELFTKKGFAFTAVGTLQEAASLVLDTLIPATQGKTVSFGGSMTVVDSGIFTAIKNNPALECIDTYDFSIGQEAVIERRRQSLLADIYICSANAITEKGEVVLLDGTGNRCAAVQFGPKHVFMLIGRNKLCTDMHAAFKRVKDFAAPINATRLKRDTPCTKTGYCMDCNSPGRICSGWSILVRSNPKDRIHLIFINQDAGY